jgi:hypothetical protein
VLACLISSIVIFPAALGWLTRGAAKEPNEEPANEIAAEILPAPAMEEQAAEVVCAETEIDITEQIEDEVAALVLASEMPVETSPDAPPITPRRRIEPPAAEPIPVPHGNAAGPSRAARESPLRHLAAVRDSDR